MAGFGAVGLTQTAIGMLIDQRAIVLYEQPDIEEKENTDASWLERQKQDNKEASGLWGLQFKYNELFTGLLDGQGVEKIANVAGINPYGISYVEAKVNKESELCDHPVETGAILTDSSIILPTTAEIVIAMPTLYFEDIYNQIEEFRILKKKIILQTKYGVYRNLVIKDVSFDLEHDTIDRAKFTLVLREIQEFISSTEEKSVSNNAKEASDVSTENTGTQVA